MSIKSTSRKQYDESFKREAVSARRGFSSTSLTLGRNPGRATECMKNMTNNFSEKSLVVLVASVFLFSSSCYHYKVVKPGQASFRENLKKGDNVKVVMKGGSQFKLEILDVTDKVIIGSYKRNQKVIPFSEIWRLEKKDLSESRILGVYVLIGVGVALVKATEMVLFFGDAASALEEEQRESDD